MTLNEKAAYLKGLAEGMKISAQDDVGKLLTEMISLLSDISDKVMELDDEADYMSEYIDELDGDLGEVEEYLFGDEEDEDYDEYDDDDYDEDDDFGIDDDYDDEVVEIECPKCGEKICVPPTVDYAHLICPACNEEFSYIEDEDSADED